MNIPYSAPIFHVYISVFLGWTLVPGSKRRRQLGAALVPVPLGGTQLGGIGSKTGTSARSRRDDWQGLVNVPFLGYWTPPFNGHYRWYTSWLGDVQLGRLMTHDWWVHSARHGGIFLQQKAWIGHKKKVIWDDLDVVFFGERIWCRRKCGLSKSPEWIDKGFDKTSRFEPQTMLSGFGQQKWILNWQQNDIPNQKLFTNTHEFLTNPKLGP